MASTFYSWLSTFLKDRGLQFSKSGFKGGANIGNHVISDVTGFWENVPYSSGKPPRWLFQIDFANGPAEAHTPNGLAEIGIGASNTAQGDKAGLAVRILPLIKTGDEAYQRLDDFEINGLFVFHGALPARSSSDGFSFNPTTGQLKRLGNPEEYIFAALLGLRPRADVVQVNVAGQDRAVTYGEVVDAVAAAIHVLPKGQALSAVATYDVSDDAEIERLKADLVAAWDAAGPAPVAAHPHDVDGLRLRRPAPGPGPRRRRRRPGRHRHQRARRHADVHLPGHLLHPDVLRHRGPVLQPGRGPGGPFRRGAVT